MEHDREAGQLLGAFFQYIEPELGLCAGLEFICAVAGADRNCEGVAAGTRCKINNLFRMGVHRFVRFNRYFVLNTGQGSQFCFNHNTMVMRIFHNLAGQGDIFFIRLGGSVDHNGSETAVNAALAEFKAVAVIEVQGDRNLRIQFNRSLNQLDQIDVVCIGTCALGNLQNNGSLQFARSVCNSLNDFHVVDVESADSIAAGVGLFKHLGSCNKWHEKKPPLSRYADYSIPLIE